MNRELSALSELHPKRQPQRARGNKYPAARHSFGVAQSVAPAAGMESGVTYADKYHRDDRSCRTDKHSGGGKQTAGHRCRAATVAAVAYRADNELQSECQRVIKQEKRRRIARAYSARPAHGVKYVPAGKIHCGV